MSRRSACAWAIEQANRCAMPAAERLLYVVLVERASAAGYCSPSQHILMDDTGLVDRHIRRLTDKLERRGYIRTEKHGRTLYYHIVRANGMDPEPKKYRTQSPVSEPVIPDTESAIDPPTPDTESPVTPRIPEPESGIPGQYRTPKPVFSPQIELFPRARVDSPYLEKKEEDSESPSLGKGEEVQEEREGGAENPTPKTPKRAFQLPDSWSPNAYSFSLGRELGLTDDEIRFEVDAMRDWALDKQQTGTQWDRRFNNWLRTAAKRRYIRGIRQKPQRTLEEEWGLGSLLTPVFDDDDLPPSERPGAPRLQ